MVNSVRISNDRTPNEIKHYKQLKDEMERRTSNGETNLKIRKGKIITINPVCDNQAVTEDQEGSLTQDSATGIVTERTKVGSDRVNSDTEEEHNFRFSLPGLESYTRVIPESKDAISEEALADSLLGGKHRV